MKEGGKVGGEKFWVRKDGSGRVGSGWFGRERRFYFLFENWEGDSYCLDVLFFFEKFKV